MTLVKICGITNEQDALATARLGADMLGFVFYKASRRYVDPETVRGICKNTPEAIARVGVFVDEGKDEVLAIAGIAGLDILQFHGSETAEYCASFSPRFKVIKAFRVKDRMSLAGINDYDTDHYLFDAYSENSAGGTGVVFDWDILKDLKTSKPFFISGGLNASNVVPVIKKFKPYGVDASSSLETSPGKKDMELVKLFIEKIRRAG